MQLEMLKTLVQENSLDLYWLLIIVKNPLNFNFKPCLNNFPLNLLSKNV